jgi:hypothetical protein
MLALDRCAVDANKAV